MAQDSTAHISDAPLGLGTRTTASTEGYTASLTGPESKEATSVSHEIDEDFIYDSE